MGTSKTILKHQLAPLNTVALARLVTDVNDPQRRFHDPFDASALQTSRTIQRNFHETAARSKNVALRSRLTELLSGFRSVTAIAGTSVTATASVTYYLLQWDSVFKNACSLESTRKWILEAIEDDQPIYFVVGYRTFLSPAVTELAGSAAGVGGEVKLPVGTVVAANFAPGIQLGSALDPGVSASVSTAAAGVRGFSSGDEMVYALQYCKVVLRWFSSRSLDRSTLGKTRWKIHWGVRGVEETGEDDVLDVELSEEFSEANAALDDLKD